MKVKLASGISLLLIAGSSDDGQRNANADRLSAPTYYIAARARTCAPDVINAFGVSNLPAGSLLSLEVSEFDDNAWREYSPTTHVALDREGYFAASIKPSGGKRFRQNLLLVVRFATYDPRQPSGVLNELGPRGEKLVATDNPQAEQVSGPNYVLETIARVPFCGNPQP